MDAKKFSFTFDIMDTDTSAASFIFWRGDMLRFSFAFKNGADDYNMASAAKMRVFAKKILNDGEVDPGLETLFFGEASNPENPATIDFESDLTNGEAGVYLLTVQLIENDGRIITSSCVEFEVKDNGNADKYTPSNQAPQNIYIKTNEGRLAAIVVNDYGGDDLTVSAKPV